MATTTAALASSLTSEKPRSSCVPKTEAAATFANPCAKGGNHEVRVIGIDEYKQAAACLAEAFKDDHTTHYFLNTPDSKLTDAQKWDLHVQMMEYLTFAHCLKGMVTTVGPNYDAVALWMPPGKNMDDLYTTLASGLWRLRYKLPREGRQRFFSEFLPLLTDAKALVLGPQRDLDSWYLVYIGTHPDSRGHGYARKLIEHVTERADRGGQACYLESSNEVNPVIYGKFGFRVCKRVWLQREKEPVELDLMVREPQGKARKDSMLEEKEEERVIVVQTEKV